MYAIVEIAGDQFKIYPEQKLKVPYLKASQGDILEFNKIFTIANGENIKIGTPLVEGSISAKVIDHGKDETVLVFHKKRRKGYQKLNGHRQRYTLIEILDFNIEGFEYKKQIQESANDDSISDFDSSLSENLDFEDDSEILNEDAFSEDKDFEVTKDFKTNLEEEENK